MKKYILKTELQTKTELMLAIPAETSADAVRLAESVISEVGEPISGALYVSGEILNASFAFERGFEFDENMIVGMSENTPDVAAGQDAEKAARFLRGKGYRYQGEEKDLASDPHPLFMKPVWTEDERGTYAYFHVTKSFDFEMEKSIFHIKAVLYPAGRSQINEDGGLSYAVEFKDKQRHITVEELPNALELYEEKFLELIMALRRADPIDGVAE